MGDRAYLDHNATTPLRPVAAEALAAASMLIGNPSSIHAEGRAARAAIDKARGQIARAVGGEAKNVIFTSGATEALNTLLRPSPDIMPLKGAKRSERLLVLATEHSAVLAGGGFSREQIETIPVDGDGIVQLDWLESRLSALVDDSGFAPVTVAVQLANSETGVVQPLSDVSGMTRRFGALLICDCVAAFGKIRFNLDVLGSDAVVISGHKFGGPKGVGAIILRGDTMAIGAPLINGGGQEMRRRSGTENVAGIAAMAAAATEVIETLDGELDRLGVLHDKLQSGIMAMRQDAVVFGDRRQRLPNTLSIGLAGMQAETTVIAFDLAGVSISSGSACSSGKVKRSHVLDAMGMEQSLAESALRFSLGWTTTEQDIDKAIAVFGLVCKGVGQRQSVAA